MGGEHPSTARHLPASGRVARPWKNGGGETAEVALAPAGASLDDFDWRVSIARVEQDGPFSLFPGVERTMAILSGAGLRLSVEGRPPAELTPESAPWRFPADVPTDCRLLGGGVTDLNVMVRRGRARATLRRLRLAAGESETFESGPALLVWAEGAGAVESAGLSVIPAPLDALRCETAARWRLRSDSAVLAWFVSFS